MNKNLNIFIEPPVALGNIHLNIPEGNEPPSFHFEIFSRNLVDYLRNQKLIKLTPKTGNI